MSRTGKRAITVALVVYFMISLGVIAKWSVHDWNTMKHGTYTVELEYVYLSPEEYVVGNKGDYNCHDGFTVSEGDEYPCSYGGYEEPYTLFDQIGRQVAIWLIGPIASVFCLAVIAFVVAMCLPHKDDSEIEVTY